MAVTSELADAVAALDPKPRTRRWSSLAYCVIDAVWSIGSRYDSVTVKVVRAVAARAGDPEPVIDALGWTPEAAHDPLPLPELLANYDVDSLVTVTNRQRTSTKNGIPKADAVLRFAQALNTHGVNDIARAADVLSLPDELGPLDKALARIPGEGQFGIRRSYFWMLVGDTSAIKPDRMVLRWLAVHGADVDPSTARTVLAQVVDGLNARPETASVTAWDVDHAIWNAQRVRR